MAGKITVVGGAVLAVSAGGSGWTSANIASLLGGNGTGFAVGSALGIDTTGGGLSYGSNIAGSMGLVNGGQYVDLDRHEHLHRRHNCPGRHAGLG